MPRTKIQQKIKPPIQSEIFNIDEFFGKYIFWLIPILVAIYYVFGSFSDGFYGDDEIGYSMNLKYSFESLGSFIGNSNKPGYRLLFFLPSLLGSKFLILSHIFLTSITVISVYFLGRELNIKNSFVAAILFAFQPFIMQFSFRTWPEILTGFFIVLTLIFYYRKKYLLSAFFSSYIFTIRQEYGIIICLILGILFLFPKIRRLFNVNNSSISNNSKKSEYNTIHYLFVVLVLGSSFIVLSILGYINSGNPLWILNDMIKYGIELAVPRQDFWHYFRMYIFIIGPVSFTLFIVGYFGFLNSKTKAQIFFKNYGVLFIVFTLSFLVHVLMAWRDLKFSGSTGALRLLLPLSPLAAIFSGIGLELFIRKINKIRQYTTMCIIIVLIFFFLSHKTDRTIIINESEYLKFAFVLILFLPVIYYFEFRLNPKAFVSIVMALGISFTLINEKPIRLDLEKEGWNEIIKWWKDNGYQNRTTLCNHIYFYHQIGVDYSRDARFQGLYRSSLEKSPVGSICIWDWHYSFRPEYNADTPLEYLKNNPQFRNLKEFMMGDDKTIFAAIFEKVNVDENEYLTWHEIIKWWRENSYQNRTTLCNHMLFYNISGIVYGNNDQFNSFDQTILKSTPIGSICIWDSRYSNRPEYKESTPIEYLQNNPNFRLSGKWAFKNGSTYAAAFEKINYDNQEYFTWAEIARWWKNNDNSNRITFCNHIFFYSSLGIHFGRNPKFQSFDLSKLKSAPIGSICIWDFRYSFKPEYNYDVQYDYLMNNSNFQILAQWKMENGTVFASVFKKIKDF